MRTFGEFIYRLSWLAAILWLTLWALIFISMGRLPNPDVVLFRLLVSAALVVWFGWLVKVLFR